MEDISVPSEDIMQFTAPDPLKGEVPLLQFHGADHGEVGRLWVRNGEMVFEGNADESARIFLECLRVRSSGWLAHLRGGDGD